MALPPPLPIGNPARIRALSRHTAVAFFGQTGWGTGEGTEGGPCLTYDGGVRAHAPCGPAVSATYRPTPCTPAWRRRTLRLHRTHVVVEVDCLNGLAFGGDANVERLYYVGAGSGVHRSTEISDATW